MNKRERMTDARQDVNNVLALFVDTRLILRKLNYYGITDEMDEAQVEEIAATAERIFREALDFSDKIRDLWERAKKKADAEVRRMQNVVCSCGDALTQVKVNADKLNAALQGIGERNRKNER